MTELNGRPVGLTPTFSRTASGPMSSVTSASVNTFEIKLDGETVVDVAGLEDLPSAVTTATPNRDEGTFAR